MPERVPGSPLRVARVRAGFRLHELAKKIDLNENTLYRIESGRTLRPTPKTRQKLAVILGVSEGDLFK